MAREQIHQRICGEGIEGVGSADDELVKTMKKVEHSHFLCVCMYVYVY